MAKTKQRDGEAAGFSAEEKAAMKERAKEVRKARSGKNDGEQDVKEKLAEMPPADRRIGKKLHAIVKKHAPELTPRTWYGMPAYAKDGKVVVFFQDAAKFKARYATVGFNDAANLDDGPMWATTFAVTELTPEVEERLAELVRRAVS